MPSGATEIDWTGGANTTSWTDAANWSGNAVPDPDPSDATYTSNYVCIGGSAKVTLSGESQYIAGLDLSDQAQLTVSSTGSLYVGAASAPDAATSSVEKGTTLTLDGGTLAGNGDVSVAGTLNLKSELVKHVADGVQSGAGTTRVTSTGVVKIYGSSSGQAELSDGRSIDNSGKITFSSNGFLLMDDGTTLTDEKGSTLALDGNGGIYPATPARSATSPSILQKGSVTESGSGKSVIAVATKFSGGKVKVSKGSLLINSNTLPKAPVARNAGYGIATCDVMNSHVCHDLESDKAVPQSAMVTTSTQAPKTTAVAVKLKSSNPKRVGGHTLIGKQIAVTASNAKTTHSTKLTLTFDASLKGVKKGLKPNVYRNGHKVTYCSKSVLTARNPQCVQTVKTLTSSPTPASKGDLQLLIISIKPKATWAVAT